MNLRFIIFSYSQPFSAGAGLSIFFFFLRDWVLYQNLLYTLDWHQTHDNVPPSASYVLRLHAYATTLGNENYLIVVKLSVLVWRFGNDGQMLICTCLIRGSSPCKGCFQAPFQIVLSFPCPYCLSLLARWSTSTRWSTRLLILFLARGEY